MKGRRFLYIILLPAMLLCFGTIHAIEKNFTVVIDAGHGGKDPGARGRDVDEKFINLNVALKLGHLIEQNCPEVRVVYTRKTDVFVELNERARIANQRKADLFISIHTNAVAKGSLTNGTEIYTLGLARSDENLSVAMRENSAILLEDNYKQKYEGFDPNSSESYIIFEFMQNKHMEQSVNFASNIKGEFVQARRVDIGVRQAGFLVLRETSMPSVLVELGYITNADEEHFLMSSNGQERLADAIYNAFIKYKWNFDRRRGLGNNKPNAMVYADETTDNNDSPTAQAVVTKSSDDPESITNGSDPTIQDQPAKDQPVAADAPKQMTDPQSSTKITKQKESGKVIYKVQFLTSGKKLASGSKLLKGYNDAEFYFENGLYKYTLGATTDFNEISKIRKGMLKDFKDAFIIGFKDGVKVNY